MLALLPSPARAHVTMTSPRPRYSAEHQKFAPCGMAGGARTTRVTVFEPGETITVEWDETVDHPSHYRIAFDAEGDDDLDEPIERGTDWITPEGVMVIADSIADRGGGGHYSSTITLPEIECERCTLQLIQIMYGRADPYYFQCADLALRCATPGCTSSEPDAGTIAPDAGVVAPVDAGTSGPRDAGTIAPRDAGTGSVADAGRGPDTIEGGCSVGRGAGGSCAGGVVLLGLAVWLARRRSRGRDQLRPSVSQSTAASAKSASAVA